VWGGGIAQGKGSGAGHPWVGAAGGVRGGAHRLVGVLAALLPVGEHRSAALGVASCQSIDFGQTGLTILVPTAIVAVQYGKV